MFFCSCYTGAVVESAECEPAAEPESAPAVEATPTLTPTLPPQPAAENSKGSVNSPV